MLGGDIRLVDGMQCMAVRQHGLMRGMVMILARLVILRCLPVKSRRLLVMRCGSL
jgi:putative component of membrane protein insertase Oxa1/YidC/SpoIIIJ protein YidD